MTEDFVPFELAKKLKEKGFNKRVHGYYWETGGLSICNTPMNSNALKNEFSAPTISQALKWLREEKGIFVLVDIQVDLRWYYEAWHIKNRLLPFGDNKYNRYDDYEAAAIEGIKYTLDNLI